jgi:uncharacterized protein YndB with AHSA1/START domain
MKLVAQELVIHAPAATVYTFLVDATRFVTWMADDAILDATPGGRIRWTHPNGDSCAGHYVELVPDRRVVFTYGWEQVDVGIPPGSTTVEIDLTPVGDDSTRLRLVHRGLDEPAADAHAGGWTHYLDRLRHAAEGDIPGPDPWAHLRVPRAAERVRRD